MDVPGYDHHVLKNLLLVKKLRKVGLELFVDLLELGKELRAAGRGDGLLPVVVTLVHQRIQRLDLLNQAAEVLEMAFAARDFFVHHEAIETFLGRLGEQLFCNRTVLLAGEAQAINQSLHFDFGRFDPLPDLNLLLAREQGYLADLLHVHLNGVIQRI